MSGAVVCAAGLQFRAAPGAALYDCHSRDFAPGDRGRSVVEEFVPQYLSLLFGAREGWQIFLRRSMRELEALPASERDAYVSERRPSRPARQAFAIARLASPSIARFLDEVPGDEAPFALRDEHLFQPNVPLHSLEHFVKRGQRIPLFREEWHRDRASRVALREVLARCATGRYDRESLSHGPQEAEFVRVLDSAGLLRSPSASPSFTEPGLYPLGHSSLLIRGRRSGLLIDPVFLSPLHGRSGGVELHHLAGSIDAVALTHGHFDHYHLPTLLGLGDLPMVLPEVPRASIVCEDLATRLAEFGNGDLRPTAWDQRLTVGDLTVDVLPFVGEQFLTSELHPEARNWGNCYVVDDGVARYLVGADCGFEPGRSLTAEVLRWVERNGPIDVVAVQALGLRVLFGDGDPDLLLTALTSVARAGEAIDLLRPERRVTLAVEDLPDLCRAARATRLVLYGQFVFERDRPSASGALIERARALLAERCPKVTVADARIGRRVDP